jgi:hypothetical protein
LIESSEQLEQSLSANELAHLQAVNSVLLLKDMHETSDLELHRSIFEQVCDQESSHISEVLPGVVNTRFNFDTKDGRLMAIQPNGITDWRKMHENGVTRARSMAELSSEFMFYEEIAKAELSEAIAQEELIAHGKPMAMITLSLSGEDIASADVLKKLGRDPNQRRAFLRVSWTNGFDNKIHLDSRSIDNMGLANGKEFIESLGAELPANANSLNVLSTQVLVDGLNEHELMNLADKLVNNYDQKLFAETGVSHIAGRSERDAHDTFKFVLEQRDLLNAHMESLCELAKRNLPLPILAEQTDNLRYDIMSSFKQRLNGTWVYRGSLAESVSFAGGSERSSGTVFAGCDTTISSKSSNSLNETGMFNAQNPENWSWKKGKCQVSECPRRVKSEKVLVGPCDVCADCQKLFDKEMSLSDINKYYKNNVLDTGEKDYKLSLLDIIAADLERFERINQEKQQAKKRKEKMQLQRQFHNFVLAS